MHYYYIEPKTGDFHTPEAMREKYAALVAARDSAVLDAQGNVLTFEEYTKDMVTEDLWMRNPEYMPDEPPVLLEYDCIDLVEDYALEKLTSDSALLQKERHTLRSFVHAISTDIVDHDITDEMAEELENRLKSQLAEKGL